VMAVSSPSYVIRRLVQGSLTWLDWRRWAVTASDVAAIAGLSPFATREQVMQQKLLGVNPVSTYAMQRGNRLEPVARRRFEGLTRKDFPPVCVEQIDERWIRASLDGLSSDGEILELKAPNWQVHESALGGVVPDYYGAQVQWQLLTTGLDVAHFATITEHSKFVPTEQLAVVRLGPDAELQAHLLEVGEIFYAELMRRKEEN